MKKIVIIGGGPAGRVIVHKLHNSAMASQFDITLIKDESINVNRCAIPYGINGKKEINKYQIPNTLITDFGAKLKLGSVKSINPESKKIILNNDEIIDYDKLVLATGATPIRPNLPGIDSPNIRTMRRIDDLDWIRQAALTSKKMAIIGAGFIGVEFAVELKKMGIKEVALIELQPHILGNNYQKEITTILENQLTSHGIQLYSNHKVTGFKEQKDGIHIQFEGDKELISDHVVLSIGVRPNVELANQAGLKCSPLGIETNQFLQTTHKDIYATGDCAQAYSFISKKPISGEFGTNAVFMSKIVSDHLLGKEKAFKGVLNASVSAIYDYSFGSTGLGSTLSQQDGIATITGISKVLDRYPMIDNVSEIITELIFEKKTHKLIGANVLRKGLSVASNIDLLSFAIQKETTIEELMELQYATHPELAAKPSDNSLVFAARDALKKF